MRASQGKGHTDINKYSQANIGMKYKCESVKPGILTCQTNEPNVDLDFMFLRSVNHAFCQEGSLF